MKTDDLMDGNSYVAASTEYERKADRALAGTDTIVLVGEGAKVHIRNMALVLYHGRTHVPQQENVIKLYAGTHHVRRLVILSDVGYITFEAVNWCRMQNIDVLILDRDGNVILTSGGLGCDLALRRLQYHAIDTGLDCHISRELVRMKTTAQIATLKGLPDRGLGEERFMVFFGQKFALPESRGRLSDDPLWKPLEDGLSELSGMKDVNMIRLLEARLAHIYWGAFMGLPIKWRPKDEKIVPPHWLSITGRISSLSGTAARQALSPFHAVLNYAYGILEVQVLSAINASGLDPACGCLHVDRVGRNSLVYDFMEPHRPQVDRLVFSLFEKTVFNRGMLVPLDSGEVRLSKQFARYVVASCMLPLSTISETVSSFVKIYRG